VCSCVVSVRGRVALCTLVIRPATAAGASLANDVYSILTAVSHGRVDVQDAAKSIEEISSGLHVRSHILVYGMRGRTSRVLPNSDWPIITIEDASQHTAD
jgi:hypothetical protein